MDSVTVMGFDIVLQRNNKIWNCPQQFYQQINLKHLIAFNKIPLEMNLSQTIDQSIKMQYQDICFNPEKKDTLLRFSKQSHQYLHQRPSLPPQLPPERLLDNKLLNYYIQHIYTKYSIEDPINKELRQMKIQDTIDLSIGKTPTKLLESSFKTQRTTTKKKLQQMKLSYKQESSQIVSTTVQKNVRPKRNSESAIVTNSRVSRQIGYRTRQKIHFKIHTNQDTLPSHNRAVFKPQVINRPSSSQFFYQKNYQHLSSSKLKLMPFNYCPICQQSIIDKNIQNLQMQCSQNHTIKDIAIDYLQRIVTKKIQNMQTEIKQRLGQHSQRQVLDGHRSLNRSVTEWLMKQDDSSFQRVQKHYQKIAVDQFQLIKKLSWFKQFHRKILELRKEQHMID